MQQHQNHSDAYQIFISELMHFMILNRDIQNQNIEEIFRKLCGLIVVISLLNLLLISIELHQNILIQIKIIQNETFGLILMNQSHFEFPFPGINQLKNTFL